ncbi:MAG: hypothetical protein ACYDA8_19805 [Deferrisomatales bacterium]
MCHRTPTSPALTAVLWLVLTASGAAAQDSHYWANQFGDRSALLGGAVVGGVRDPSAGYYNPGALGFVGNSNLTVGANAFRFNDLHVVDGVGGASELDSEEVEAIPLLVAGVFDPPSIPGVVAYSLLARNTHTMKVSGQRAAVEEVLGGALAAGPERFLGTFSREDRLLEVWAGVSYALPLRPGLSVGVTTFAALRNQDLDQDLSVRALNEATHFLATRDEHTSAEFWNLRLLWKAGLAAESGPWRLGLVVTTPSVNLAGRGEVAADLSYIHLDVTGEGEPDHFFTTSRRGELDSEFRSPLSVAAGAEYRFSRSTLVAVSAEWFHRQPRYSVLAVDDPVFAATVASAPLLGNRSSLAVTAAARSVGNVAVGLEQGLTPRLTAFLSLRTDRTYLSDSAAEGIPLGYNRWDLYHGTLGARFRRQNSDFGVGLGYSYGRRDNFPQTVNFGSPTDGGLLAGPPQEADATYQAFTVFFGITYYVR